MALYASETKSPDSVFHGFRNNRVKGVDRESGGWDWPLRIGQKVAFKYDCGIQMGILRGIKQRLRTY
jgi:hypothetical protein